MWHPVLFILFVTYPSTTVISMLSFSCRTILGKQYLSSDYSLACPADTKGFVYFWSILCLCIYAAGVPLLSLGLLFWYKVPALAQRKRQLGKLDSFVTNFLARTAMPHDAKHGAADLGSPSAESPECNCMLESSRGWRQSVTEWISRKPTQSVLPNTNTELVFGRTLSAQQAVQERANQWQDPAILRMAAMVAWRVPGDEPAEQAREAAACLACVQGSEVESDVSEQMQLLVAAKVLRLVVRGLLHVPRQTWDGSSGVEEAKAIEQVGIAFKNVFADAWWYDALEFWRKFMSASLIAIVWPGTIEQTHTALVICMVASLINAVKQPRVVPAAQAMQTYALLALTAIVYYGLLLQSNAGYIAGVPSDIFTAGVTTWLCVCIVCITAGVFLFPAGTALCAYLSSPRDNSHLHEFIRDTGLPGRIRDSCATSLAVTDDSMPSERRTSGSAPLLSPAAVMSAEPVEGGRAEEQAAREAEGPRAAAADLDSEPRALMAAAQLRAALSEPEPPSCPAGVLLEMDPPVITCNVQALEEDPGGSYIKSTLGFAVPDARTERLGSGLGVNV